VKTTEMTRELNHRKLSSTTRAEKVCMWFLLVFGLVCIPLGLALWLTLPPLGTREYVQVGAFRQSIGESLYSAGFLFLIASLLYTKYKAYFSYVLPALIISGGTLIILGIHLVQSFQTYIYDPFISTGFGFVSGGVFDLIYIKFSKKGCR